MRTNEDMIHEIENAADGQGPTPLASYTGTALNDIMDAVDDRTDAEDRISRATFSAPRSPTTVCAPATKTITHHSKSRRNRAHYLPRHPQ